MRQEAENECTEEYFKMVKRLIEEEGNYGFQKEVALFRHKNPWSLNQYDKDLFMKSLVDECVENALKETK